MTYRSHTDAPPRPSLSADYEFEALAAARNYRRGILREFTPYLRGDVLEVGAGIGLVTAELRGMPAVRHLTAVEPDAGFCDRLRAEWPAGEVIHGTVAAVPAGRDYDAVVCVNVLEHIPDDSAELKAYRDRLAARGGHLCLFVPAGARLYAPLDRRFGHVRRYDAPELAAKLRAAGFEIVTLHHFNGLGYLLWWVEFSLLKRRRFARRKVWLFDHFVFPVLHFLESRVCRPPRGQSLLAVARVPRTGGEADRPAVP
jgi:SAM-dependent methyltransferase